MSNNEGRRNNVSAHPAYFTKQESQSVACSDQVSIHHGASAGVRVRRIADCRRTPAPLGLGIHLSLPSCRICVHSRQVTGPPPTLSQERCTDFPPRVPLRQSVDAVPQTYSDHPFPDIVLRTGPSAHRHRRPPVGRQYRSHIGRSWAKLRPPPRSRTRGTDPLSVCWCLSRLSRWSPASLQSCSCHPRHTVRDCAVGSVLRRGRRQHVVVTGSSVVDYRASGYDRDGPTFTVIRQCAMWRLTPHGQEMPGREATST
jgi:hypothetical protein